MAGRPRQDMASNAFDRPVDGPSLDRVFGVLADERRRDVLYYLLRGPEDTASVETLADHLAESESDVPDSPEEIEESDEHDDATTDRRERAIAIELSHVHLPKLDAADVVEYGYDSETVEYEGDETVEVLLDATTAED